MIGRVDLKLQNLGLSRSDDLNILYLRSGQSRRPVSLRRAGRVMPRNPTRPDWNPSLPVRWHGLRRRIIEMRYLWSNVLTSKLEQGRIEVVFVLHIYTVGTILSKFFSSISFRFASNSSTSQFTLNIINHKHPE